MISMGPVHARDSSLGLSSAEPERTARYRDLLRARTGIAYCRSHKNRPRACGHA